MLSPRLREIKSIEELVFAVVDEARARYGCTLYGTRWPNVEEPTVIQYSDITVQWIWQSDGHYYVISHRFGLHMLMQQQHDVEWQTAYHHVMQEFDKQLRDDIARNRR